MILLKMREPRSGGEAEPEDIKELRRRLTYWQDQVKAASQHPDMPDARAQKEKAEQRKFEGGGKGGGEGGEKTTWLET